MSRRHHEEEEFNSSSFLDVICNVVGILIVLIVIAGVRTRAPLRPNPTPDDPKTFAGYLHALRWGCVTSTDPTLFQVLVVADDLDPFPATPISLYGTTEFHWSIVPPGN